MKGFLRRLAEGVGRPVDRRAQVHPFVESSYGFHPDPVEEPAPLADAGATSEVAPAQGIASAPASGVRERRDDGPWTAMAPSYVASEAEHPAPAGEEVGGDARDLEPGTALARRARARSGLAPGAALRVPTALLPVDLPGVDAEPREPRAGALEAAAPTTDARTPAGAPLHPVSRLHERVERGRDVHIHIGRIEVLAVPPPVAARPAAPPAPKGPSLDEYLRRKGGSGGAR